jgi:DNA-binding response OmpR family regulator
MDGVEVIKRIREWSQVPIIVLSVRDREDDKVGALDAGADDYLTKPFSIREMVARVGAILRRNERIDSPPTATAARHIRSRDVTLDPERREATVRGELVDLTKQEFDLFYLLAARPGIVFSRAALLTKVWTDDTYVTERTVDTVISRLRRKVEQDAQSPELILTAWGVGYKFVDVE